jgi:hypothetical protein
MSSQLNMTYNSQRELLKIPEYGRNVQNLINHAKTIEDPEYRQRFVERIVYLMQQMNPENANNPDSKQRYWGHLYSIADYDLEVTPPEGISVSPDNARLRPEKLAYPEKSKKFRHYGNNVKIMIDKAVEMEDGEKKDAYMRLIGSFMKLAYKNWNKEHYVNDEIIKGDLKAMSAGKLIIGDNVALDALANSVKKKPQQNKNKNHKSNKNRNKKRNNNYKKRR